MVLLVVVVLLLLVVVVLLAWCCCGCCWWWWCCCELVVPRLFKRVRVAGAPNRGLGPSEPCGHVQQWGVVRGGRQDEAPNPLNT